MKYVPKEIAENVNVTPVNPLINLGNLLATVAVFSGLMGVIALALSSLAVRRIDAATEIKIGKALSAGMVPNVRAADSRTRYLAELVEQLQADAPGAAPGYSPSAYPPVTVRIIDSPVENAMVMAGSQLFVTDGLLAAMESENELAFVLGHELGHLYYRDPVKALGRSLVWIGISSVLGVGGNQLPGVVSGAVNLQEMSYSRRQETAADRYGLKTVIAHYGHGGSSLGFFERMQTEEPDWGALSTVAEWQQTHPFSKNRIQRLKVEVEQQEWTTEGEVTPLPEGIDCPNFEPCGSD